MKQKKICGIYCINNSKYFYIGQSVDINRRWNKHKWELKNQKHKNTIIQNVYNQYSDTDPFEFIIIKEADASSLNNLEKQFITEYSYKFPEKRCMNITDPEKCYTSNIEIREKISISLTGRSLSEQIKKKMSLTRKGKKNLWNRKQIVQIDLNGNLIKIWDCVKDAERNLKVRIHKKNKICGGYQWQFYEEWIKNPKGKVKHKHNITDTVKQYNINGQLLNIWKSPKQACQQTGVPPSSLSACLNNKQKTAGGFIWSYGECPKIKILDKYISIKKKVEQYNTDGQLLNIYKTINAAMMSTGITAYKIKRNINGKCNNAGGFIWKYQK